MNLSILERLSVIHALPKEGDYATLKILTDLRMSLSFTEEEMKKWEIITNEQGGISWSEKAEEVEIPIGEKATDIIVAGFKKLDSEKKLQEDMVSAYEKFITTE